MEQHWQRNAKYEDDFLKIPRLRIWGVRYVEYIYIMIHIYVRIMNIRYQIFENGLVTGVREGCYVSQKSLPWNVSCDFERRINLEDSNVDIIDRGQASSGPSGAQICYLSQRTELSRLDWKDFVMILTQTNSANVWLTNSFRLAL